MNNGLHQNLIFPLTHTTLLFSQISPISTDQLNRQIVDVLSFSVVQIIRTLHGYVNRKKAQFISNTTSMQEIAYKNVGKPIPPGDESLLSYQSYQ